MVGGEQEHLAGWSKSIRRAEDKYRVEQEHGGMGVSTYRVKQEHLNKEG
jgi:hypothetical protein